MGFRSGDHGVKHHLILEICKSATYRVIDMNDAVNELGIVPDTTAILRDGNVMVSGMPQNVRGFGDWVDTMERMVRASLRTSRFVLICFDDPEHVTDMKWETQAKRQRRLHAQNPMLPTDDNYDATTVNMLEDCHPLIGNRRTRYRFIDELIVRIMSRIKDEPGLVIFDGVDIRGAGRLDERTPAIHFSGHLASVITETSAAEGVQDELSLCAQTARSVAEVVREMRTTPLGEADLKLRVAEQAVRVASRRLAADLNTRKDADKAEDVEVPETPPETPEMPPPIGLILVDTVDTDQFAVSVLMTSERRDHEPRDLDDITTLLVMRERGKFASTQLRNSLREAGHNVESLAEDTAGILLIDVDHCHALLANRMREIGCFDGTHCTTSARLTFAVAALSGCDFVSPAERYDRLDNAFLSIAERYGPALAALNWGSAEGRARAQTFLREVLTLAHEDNTRRTAAKLSEADLMVCIDRSLQAVSYWSLEEYSRLLEPQSLGCRTVSRK